MVMSREEGYIMTDTLMPSPFTDHRVRFSRGSGRSVEVFLGVMHRSDSDAPANDFLEM